MTAWRVHARSYHVAIPQHAGPIVVHAVFGRSLHLRRGNGAILTVTESPWNGPLTIRVPGGTLHDGLVVPGTVGKLSADRLVLDDLIIELASADAWSPDPVKVASLRPEKLEQHLHYVQSAIAAARRGGLGAWKTEAAADEPAWLRRGRAAISSLLSALIEFDADVLSERANGLLGLGPGLTPSGDDVLCGLTAGMSVIGTRFQRYRRRCDTLIGAISRDVLPLASSHTTSLSATLLYWSTRGVVVEPLHRILQSVGGDAPIARLDDVLILGHSSGSDMLTGVLLACTALSRWEEVFGSTLDRSREHLLRLDKADEGFRGVGGDRRGAARRRGDGHAAQSRAPRR